MDFLVSEKVGCVKEIILLPDNTPHSDFMNSGILMGIFKGK